MSNSDAPLRPVFYDESRKRWSWVLRLGIAALLIVSFSLTAFVISIIALPLLPHNALPKAQATADTGNPDPALSDRNRARRQYALRVDKRKLELLEKEHRQRVISRSSRVGERTNAFFGPPMPAEPIVAGFYVNWEETSRASLRRNIEQITHFFPEWLHISRSPDEAFTDARIPEDRIDIDPFVRSHGVPIVPVINNYLPTRAGGEDGAWDTQAVHNLIASPDNRAYFIGKLRDFLVAQKWQGINIDFEQVAASDRDDLTRFMQELHNSFHAADLIVTQDVAVEDPAFDVPKLALESDAIMPMVYDEHSPGDEAGPGAIASVGWTRQILKKLFAQVPADKVVLAFGNYAYDWKKGNLNAESETFQSAILTAKESSDPDDPTMGKVRLDPGSLNPYYRYYDENGALHIVWMLDAVSAYNQWQAAKQYHPRGLALWYMGSEDPTFWSVLGRGQIEADSSPVVDGGALNTLSYGRQSEVDFEGEGELLKVMAEPSDGHRTVRRDPKTGLIVAEDYTEYPSSYVVRRYGYQPRSVVLTFDDGPDPSWTPKILDILKSRGVHGTFFVVGKQAEEHPDLIARIWDGGNEIGNHTYTHPNVALTSSERTLVEINATQRIIEAITGHKTTLFRPPYAIDTEPRTGGDLRSIIQASQWGFISVGEKNDPQDWNLYKKGPDGTMVRRTATDIVDSALYNRDVGNVILLHDGGGDRTATLAALPQIIDRLKAHGYRFITLSQLSGIPRDRLFPRISGRDQVLVGIDRYVFESTYLVQRVLVTLFTLSVILGISRQLWMTLLALIQRRRERERERRLASLPAGAMPGVSVVIAAYNEEKVIERTVQTILASSYPDLEIIVVDDGSRDHTFEVVSTAFAGESRVTCIRKENGGKATALNRGLREAHGEVIVALDADTLFAPDTIERLARHFADPKVGAVSGNVRVGNAHNILTKWQSLEYITSQNFDRRAYDLMNCITVVPGAVGAWRREALDQAGGYTHDTLAEDTDLTWKIRRAGWRILNDSTALAFTEAPESLRNLSRQRYRWAFGTLQNLWKHREATFRHGAFGWVALPSLWLYQILFPAISPIMDATVVLALILGNFSHVLFYYGLMVGVEFLGAALAIKMDRGDWKLLPWLFFQRFLYRQLMYYVILKSLASAVRGHAVGWNKFERRGTVRLEEGKAVIGSQKPEAESREKDRA